MKLRLLYEDLSRRSFLGGVLGMAASAFGGQGIRGRHSFDYHSFISRLVGFEGVRDKVYDDGKGILTIGIGHAFTNESKSIFKELFGNKVDFNAIISGKARLTPEQISALAVYDVDRHIDRAKRVFPKFDTYPTYVQHALLDSVYRGDTGKLTANLINNDKWAEAADEYINRRDYRNARKDRLSGIISRMDTNRKAMLKYANELSNVDRK